MPEQMLSDYAIGTLVIFGVTFLALVVGYFVRYFALSTRKQMCTMDRKEAKRIARDEATSEFNSRLREMDKKKNQLKNAADVYKEIVLGND